MMVGGERVLDGLGLATHEVDTKFVSERDEVPPRMTVALGILGNQLFDSCLRHADGPFPFTLLELHLLIQRTLERKLEVQRDWWRLAFGALGVTTLAGLELIFLGRATRTDLVLLVGRGCSKGDRVGTAPVVVFRHICSRWFMFVWRSRGG